jgi:hypothetical protein
MSSVHPPKRFDIIGLGINIPHHVTLQATNAISKCQCVYTIVQQPSQLWLPVANVGTRPRPSAGIETALRQNAEIAREKIDAAGSEVEGALAPHQTMYEFDRPKFLMERFEDETVLVNVISGYYYSLSGSGPDVLALLDTGLSVEEAAEVLGAGTGNLDSIRQMVASFATQLLEESVLVPRRPLTASVPRTQAVNGNVAAFTPPELTRFDDMREILLLDPVHQVDQAAGWPNRQ